MLTMALLDCAILAMENVAVLTEDGTFALSFRPHPGGSAQGGGGGAAEID